MEPEQLGPQSGLIVTLTKEEHELDESLIDTVVRARQTAVWLAAWGRFYAVASGICHGLFPTWFAAGNQVLNVSGSMQERFKSQLKALQCIAAYFQAAGIREDIVEYDEFEGEVWRYKLSEVPRRV